MCHCVCLSRILYFRFASQLNSLHTVLAAREATYTHTHTMSMKFCREAHILPWGWDEDHDGSDDIPIYSVYEHYIRFVFSSRNIIDLASILPFYVTVKSNQLKETFIRVLRLFRMFKIFNVVSRFKRLQNMVTLLTATVETSMPAMIVMAMFSFISFIFFGALIYVLESGQYNISEEYPDGVFLRRTIDGYGKEITPFNSAATSIYWVVSTVTTGESSV